MNWAQAQPVLVLFDPQFLLGEKKGFILLWNVPWLLSCVTVAPQLNFCWGIWKQRANYMIVITWKLYVYWFSTSRYYYFWTFHCSAQWQESHCLYSRHALRSHDWQTFKIEPLPAVRKASWVGKGACWLSPCRGHPEVSITHIHVHLTSWQEPLIIRCSAPSGLNEAHSYLCPWILGIVSNRKGPHLPPDIFIYPSVMCLG